MSKFTALIALTITAGLLGFMTPTSAYAAGECSQCINECTGEIEHCNNGCQEERSRVFRSCLKDLNKAIERANRIPREAKTKKQESLFGPNDGFRRCMQDAREATEVCYDNCYDSLDSCLDECSDPGQPCNHPS